LTENKEFLRIDFLKLIGLGANLDHPVFGKPEFTLKAAIDELGRIFKIERQSSFYQSAPVPLSDQPWFINAVIVFSTSNSLDESLKLLHIIEKKFGRVRSLKWEARVLDLDLLAFDDFVTVNREQGKGVVVPHPMIAERKFVLEPISEIAPNWRHPLLELTADQMLSALPVLQKTNRLQSS
jgi:2-amino-4-hydroxy-6-hydroxymethyldihydropteridine diphosphokinase